MNLGDSIRHGTKWLFTGSVGGQVLQFVFGVALARLLVPGDFGLLVTVQIFTGFVGMIASGGMGEALVQAKQIEERDLQSVFTIQVVIGLMIYGGFFLVAPSFAAWFGNPVYEDLLRVSALSFLIRPFSTQPSIRLRRAMRFKEIAIIGFVSVTAAGLVSVALAANGHGVWSLVIGGLSSALLSAALLWVRLPWRPGLRVARESVRALGGYGSKNVLNELLVYFRGQAYNFVITKTSGAALVGLYNKADSLAAMPVRLLGGATYQTVFRALSRAQDNLDQSRYLYLRTLTLLAFYTLPVYLALAWITEPLIVGVFGPHWRDTAAPLAILCLTAPFRCLEFSSGAVAAARNRLGRESILQFQAVILAAAGAAFAIRYGIVGVAWAAVAESAYLGIRLGKLALDSLQYRWKHLFAAILPVAGLCAAEAGALLAAHIILEDWRPAMPSLLYAAVVAGAGLVTYAALFLLRPPAVLTAEANRWRRSLRLAELAVSAPGKTG